jgi:hypothetical protein
MLILQWETNLIRKSANRELSVKILKLTCAQVPKIVSMPQGLPMIWPGPQIWHVDGEKLVGAEFVDVDGLPIGMVGVSEGVNGLGVGVVKAPIDNDGAGEGRPKRGRWVGFDVWGTGVLVGVAVVGCEVFRGLLGRGCFVAVLT